MRIKEAELGRVQTARFYIVVCKACSAQWQTDPALEVACSKCQARPGERCTWRNQHDHTYHIGRDLQAMREGHLTACDALTWDGRHSRHEILVCDEPVPTHLTAASACKRCARLDDEKGSGGMRQGKR